MQTNGEPCDTFLGRAGGTGPSSPYLVSTQRGLLGASGFVDGSGVPRRETEWQFSRAADFAGVLAAKRLRREKPYRNQHLMACVRPTELSPDPAAAADAAFVRVRYRNEALAWSAWSGAVTLGVLLSH